MDNRVLETADGTPLGAINRTKDDGLADASGTFSCYADSGTGLTDVMPTADTPFRGSGVFHMDGSAGSRKLTVQMLITGFDVTVNLDGNIVVTYQWVLNGDVGAIGDFAVV